MPTMNPPSRRRSSRAQAIVRLAPLGGLWEVAARDRRRGVWPEEITCEWDDWGPKTARFLLRREAGQNYPDLSGLTPVDICQGAGVWEGFIDQTPVQDEHTLSVECIGWPDEAGDDVLQRTYVHSLLSDWRDLRTHLDADLAKLPQAFRAEADGGGIVIGAPNTSVWPNSTAAAVVLDLGEGNGCARVVLEVQRGPGTPANVALYCRSSDTPGGFLGAATTDSSFSGTALNTISATSQILRSSFATKRRYLTIFVWNNGATYTAGADDLVRIRAAQVFTNTAYEAGDASALTASTALADLLPLCQDWSQDPSGIAATQLTFPHLAATAPRSFREWVDALNAPHGYVRKLERGRRFRFKPRPTVPVLAAGAWPGITYRDASKNATRDLYNKAIGQGTNGAGEPIRVERYAGQQPGVPGEQLAAFSNPSFDVDVAGWTAAGGAPAPVRETAAGFFDTAPASMRLTGLNAGTITASLAGTFKRGVVYRLMFKWRRDTIDYRPELRFGDVASGDYTPAPFWLRWDGVYVFGLALSTWIPITVLWVPKADTSAASVQLFDRTGGSGQGWFDSFTVEVVSPTLLDRRRRLRAKTVDMPSQAVDPFVMQAFADVWLQSHMRTRASGSIEASGSVLRDYVSGEAVRPFELGERTNELVCLLNEIDPDTGAIGRDVPITAVAATPGIENSQLTLDTPYEDFDRLVSRYDLIAGGR